MKEGSIGRKKKTLFQKVVQDFGGRVPKATKKRGKHLFHGAKNQGGRDHTKLIVTLHSQFWGERSKEDRLESFLDKEGNQEMDSAGWERRQGSPGFLASEWVLEK